MMCFNWYNNCACFLLIVLINFEQINNSWFLNITVPRYPRAFVVRWIIVSRVTACVRMCQDSNVISLPVALFFILHHLFLGGGCFIHLSATTTTSVTTTKKPPPSPSLLSWSLTINLQLLFSQPADFYVRSCFSLTAAFLTGFVQKYTKYIKKSKKFQLQLYANEKTKNKSLIITILWFIWSFISVFLARKTFQVSHCYLSFLCCFWGLVSGLWQWQFKALISRI